MDNETKDILQQILVGQQELKQEISSVKTDVSNLSQELYEVKKLATKTALIIENDISKKIGHLYDHAQDNIRHNEEQKQLCYIS